MLRALREGLTQVADAVAPIFQSPQEQLQRSLAQIDKEYVRLTQGRAGQLVVGPQNPEPDAQQLQRMTQLLNNFVQALVDEEDELQDLQRDPRTATSVGPCAELLLNEPILERLAMMGAPDVGLPRPRGLRPLICQTLEAVLTHCPHPLLISSRIHGTIRDFVLVCIREEDWRRARYRHSLVSLVRRLSFELLTIQRQQRSGRHSLAEQFWFVESDKLQQRSAPPSPVVGGRQPPPGGSPAPSLRPASSLSGAPSPSANSPKTFLLLPPLLACVELQSETGVAARVGLLCLVRILAGLSGTGFADSPLLAGLLRVLTNEHMGSLASRLLQSLTGLFAQSVSYMNMTESFRRMLRDNGSFDFLVRLDPDSGPAAASASSASSSSSSSMSGFAARFRKRTPSTSGSSSSSASAAAGSSSHPTPSNAALQRQLEEPVAESPMQRLLQLVIYLDLLVDSAPEPLAVQLVRTFRTEFLEQCLGPRLMQSEEQIVVWATLLLRLAVRRISRSRLLKLAVADFLLGFSPSLLGSSGGFASCSSSRRGSTGGGDPASEEHKSVAADGHGVGQSPHLPLPSPCAARAPGGPHLASPGSHGSPYTFGHGPGTCCSWPRMAPESLREAARSPDRRLRSALLSRILHPNQQLCMASLALLDSLLAWELPEVLEDLVLRNLRRARWLQPGSEVRKQLGAIPDLRTGFRRARASDPDAGPGSVSAEAGAEAGALAAAVDSRAPRVAPVSGACLGSVGLFGMPPRVGGALDPAEPRMLWYRPGPVDQAETGGGADAESSAFGSAPSPSPDTGAKPAATTEAEEDQGGQGSLPQVQRDEFSWRSLAFNATLGPDGQLPSPSAAALAEQRVRVQRAFVHQGVSLVFPEKAADADTDPSSPASVVRGPGRSAEARILGPCTPSIHSAEPPRELGRDGADPDGSDSEGEGENAGGADKRRKRKPADLDAFFEGVFLYTLLTRFRSWYSNGLTVNLLLTSVWGRVVRSPVPLLHAYAFHTGLEPGYAAPRLANEAVPGQVLPLASNEIALPMQLFVQLWRQGCDHAVPGIAATDQDFQTRLLYHEAVLALQPEERRRLRLGTLGWDPFAHLRLGSFSTLHQSLPALVVGSARIRNLHLQAREARLAQLRGEPDEDEAVGGDAQRQALPTGAAEQASPASAAKPATMEEGPNSTPAPLAASGDTPAQTVAESPESSALSSAAPVVAASGAVASASVSPAATPKSQRLSRAAPVHRRRLSLLDAELAAGLDYEVGSDAIIDDSEDPTIGFLSAYLTLRHFLGELLAVQRVKHELFRHAARDLLDEFRNYLEAQQTPADNREAAAAEVPASDAGAGSGAPLEPQAEPKPKQPDSSPSPVETLSGGAAERP